MTQQNITEPRMNMYDALTTTTRSAELFVLHDNQWLVRALEHVLRNYDVLTTFNKSLMLCEKLEIPIKSIAY